MLVDDELDELDPAGVTPDEDDVEGDADALVDDADTAADADALADDADALVELVPLPPAAALDLGSRIPPSTDAGAVLVLADLAAAWYCATVWPLLAGRNKRLVRR